MGRKVDIFSLVFGNKDISPMSYMTCRTPNCCALTLQIGRVLPTSGAAEVINQILREEGSMKQIVGNLSGVTSGDMDPEGSEPWDSIALRYVDRSLSNLSYSSAT